LELKKKLQKIECGDAILVRNSNKKAFISKGICWVTHSRVSHTALYVGGGENKIIEYTGDGCRVAKLSKYFGQDFTIWVRRIKGLTTTQASLMKSAAYNDVGKNYDFLSYIPYIFYQFLRAIGLGRFRKRDMLLHADDKQVCSSAYDKWAKSANVDLFPNLGEQQPTPEDILKNKLLRTIMVIKWE